MTAWTGLGSITRKPLDPLWPGAFGYVKGFDAMAKAWGGPRVTRIRQRMAKQLPVICWRCGQWITEDMAWTVGHIIEVDRAPELMWDEENHRHEHATCNYSAGATYGNRKRGRATQVSPTSRAWVRGVSA